MSGINVGSGIPENYLWPFLEEPKSILYNRDIEYENQREDENGMSYDLPIAIDVKAQSDGKFWRFIGRLFTVITYSGVSEETALEFDAILDTLCYSPPSAENPQ
jgi:hypothetical protein